MNNPLFYSVGQQSRAGEMRDQIQVALAIADGTMLKSLLSHCVPAIAPPTHIGTVSSEVGIPIGADQAADAVVQFEAIRCVLAALPPRPESTGDRTQDSKDLARMVQHESELQTLGQHLPLALAIALLGNAGFQSEQVSSILRLPHYAWYKSWWYAVDDEGNFTQPFLRCIRSFHYPDGTLTLQYKDFFEQKKPDCFTSLAQKVLLVIQAEEQGFAATLKGINRQREALGIPAVILMCDRVTELEAQAFMRQGISLYPAQEMLLPVVANCEHCGRRECPMNHRLDSPVKMCRGFLLESEFV